MVAFRVKDTINHEGLPGPEYGSNIFRPARVSKNADSQQNRLDPRSTRSCRKEPPVDTFTTGGIKAQVVLVLNGAASGQELHNEQYECND